MYDYTKVPPFIDQSVKPNILILLDNSGSMNEYIYREQKYNPETDYYGYFTSKYRYTYTGNYFEIDDPGGQWCGNFLNYMTTRRIDAMRKVAFGGYMHSAVGTGKQTITIDAAPRAYRGQERYIHDVTSDDLDGVDISEVSPYTNVNSFQLDNDGEINVVGGDSYDTVAMKDPILEPDCFYEYDTGAMRLGGVMQEFGRDANWGNMWFVEDGGVDSRPQGGEIDNPVGSIVQFSNLITSLRNKPSDTWTPLAESYYVAMQHFRQQAIEVDRYRPQAPAANHDPFDHSEWCAKNFVLILSDGASTRDSHIPNYLKNYADNKSPSFFLTDQDGSGWTDDDNGRYPRGGTDFLKDIAYYARANNLRDDVDGHTHIMPYIVLAFESPGEDGDNQEYFDARELLMETARQGGWHREINDNIPGLDKDNNLADGIESKWDLVPDNYFEAQDGHDLEDALRAAIQAMLDVAASTTAPAAEPMSQELEGSVIQAYFKAEERDDTGQEITWPGYLEALWLDKCGNFREDTTGDGQLDVSKDKIVKYEFDPIDRQTIVKRYTTHPHFVDEEDLSCELPENANYVYEYLDMDEIDPIFEAGKMLHNRSHADRRIYANTYLKDDGDSYPIDRMTPFKVDNIDKIRDFLGVNDASVDSAYSLGHLGNEAERAEVLINYIRGDDNFPGLRSRTITVDNVSNTWKLGSIVNSSPASVSGASHLYHRLYGDRSYRNYEFAQRGREMMIYVGSNNGMLHAFTHGIYDSENKAFEEVDNTKLGTEVWAYIPQALLPHLKWLADPNYSHVFYADLTPKVFDAKIKNNGDEWGTFLLLGLNWGGKRIFVDMDGEEKVFWPTYTLIDITDPREPDVMWERSYGGSGLTTSIPEVFKVGDEWFATFGSGPNDHDGKRDYEGESDQNSKIFVINLEDGAPYKDNDGNDWLWELEESNSFLNSPTRFDKNINYNWDGILFGETYDTNQGFKGKIHKINIPCDPCGRLDHDYDDDPDDWKHSVLFESPGPVTASVEVGSDPLDNVMVFFGTGKYMGHDDTMDEDQQYLFGIRDPFYDRSNSIYYRNYNNTRTLTKNDLFDSRGAMDGESLDEDRWPEEDWDALIDEVRGDDGWYLELNTHSPSERIITKPVLISGALLAQAYTPIDDVCEFGGEGRFINVYYQTGTPKPGDTITVGDAQVFPPPPYITTLPRQDTFSVIPPLGDIFDVPYADPLRDQITNWRDR